MTTLGEHLNKIYFDPSHPASFGGPRKLYTAVKNDKYNPTFSFIQQWVQNQEAYSIHKPARHKFPRNRVVVTGRDDTWDVDLMDMVDINADNDGIKYLLVVIDIYSKYLWVRPLKNKTAKEIKMAMEDILNINKKTKKIRSDKGKEFDNSLLKTFLKDKGIYYYVTQNEGKANYAERVIKTLKNKIIRYLTHNNTRRYIPVLQDFVTSYNNTVHRTLGMKPSQMTKKVARASWWKIYKPKAVYKVKPYKFRIGDTVRISFLRGKFDKEYDQKFSGELFTVTKRYRRSGIPVYHLKDYHDEPIIGSFYTQQLQKVVMDPAQTWKVEKVLKRRTRKGVKEVFIKWLRWPDRFNSWIPAADLQDL